VFVKTRIWTKDLPNANQIWYANVRQGGLDDRGSRVRFPAVAGNFSLHHRVQNGSGAHPASCPTGTGGSFPGGIAAGGVKLTTHLRLVPRSRMSGAIPPFPQYVFMACLVKHRYNFTFTFYLKLYKVYQKWEIRLGWTNWQYEPEGIVRI
jgi:hypothetical protein